MALTKASLTALSAVTTTQTSSAQNVANAYSATAYVSIVQVGTATTPASFTVQYSPDGTTYYSSPVFSAGTAAGTYTWEVAIPSDAQDVKVGFTAQAGGTSSTCTAQIGTITGL